MPDPVHGLVQPVTAVRQCHRVVAKEHADRTFLHLATGPQSNRNGNYTGTDVAS